MVQDSLNDVRENANGSHSCCGRSPQIVQSPFEREVEPILGTSIVAEPTGALTEDRVSAQDVMPSRQYRSCGFRQWHIMRPVIFGPLARESDQAGF
jgi:hypothetical protein